MMKLSVLILIASYLLLLKKEDSINYALTNKMDYHPYELTEEEMPTLQDIASRCPLKYGQAVYSARVLINTQHGHESEFWDDEDICVYGQNYRRANPFISDEITNDITFYPNPTKDILYYKINSKVEEEIVSTITINNIHGSILETISIPMEITNGSIDLSKYANGIYIVNYYIDRVSKYHQKIIISK